MTLVSQSSSFDAKAGKNILTYTYEDFHDYYTPPSGSFDIQKTLSDGKYTTTYKVYDSPGGAYNYQLQSSLSTEPLLTHRIFAAGGAQELSAEDKKKIQEAQQDPAKFAEYVAAGATTPLGWYSQFVLWGIESYLAPSVSLHITADEDSLPHLSDLGKIASITNGPSLDGSANWLFSGCTAEALTNGQWRISREYRGSGPEGWNSTLYST